MPASYSYIDVATLDTVRQRFAAADALAILSTDLDQIIWANGPGAELFGYGDIGAALGAASRLGFAAKRQIAATSGFPDIGKDRAIGVRLTTGMTSRVAALLASSVELPDGEKAILLAVPAPQAASPDRRELARRAISGFSEPGQFTALVGAGGAVEAASEGFDRLGISGETLARLVAGAQGERDRTARRTVEAGRRSLPAGLARLTDDPARYLLVVIDEGADEIAAEPAPEPSVEMSAAEPDIEAEASAIPATAATDDANGDAADGLVEFVDDEDGFEETATTPASGNRPAEQDNRPHQHDEWYFSGNEEAVAPTVPAGEAPASHGADAEDDEAAADRAARPAIDKAAAPIRFVWRTDADGRFSTISPEFAAAVGSAAADVVGKSFGEVAAAFRLDPDGEIARLLERRDTWSGRSVLWPVADTDLKVPVDLAALPAYSRDRKFEGFRGFGVARTGDAIVDADGVGLNLAAAVAASAAPAPEAALESMPTDAQAAAAKPADKRPAEAKPSSADAGKPADPFKGEVPVLSIVPKPDRRFSDKVIRLAEHRTPQNDKGLSSVERNAFREIGERLRKDATPNRAEETKVSAAEVAVADTSGRAGTAEAQENAAAGVESVAASVEGAPNTAADMSAPSETADTRAANDIASDETNPAVEAAETPAELAHALDETIAFVEGGDEPLLIDEGSDAGTLDDLAALDGVEAVGLTSDTQDILDEGDAEAVFETPDSPDDPHAAAGGTAGQLDDEPVADSAAHPAQDDETPAAGTEPAEATIAAVADPDKTVEPTQPRPRRGASLLDFMERRPTGNGIQAPDASVATGPEQPDATPPQAAARSTTAATETEDDDAETAAYAEAETAAHEAEIVPEAWVEASAEPVPAQPAETSTVEAGHGAVGPTGPDVDAAVPADDVAETPFETATPLESSAVNLVEPAAAQAAEEEAYHIEAVVPAPAGDAGAGAHAVAAHTHLQADNDESFAPEAEYVSEAAEHDADTGEIVGEGETDGDDEHDDADADDDSAEAPRRAGADTSILDKLPVPVLIHAGDTLHHANAEFLALTGYDDLEALAADGGLGRLFAASDEDHVDGSDRQMRLTRSDGSDVPVDAHLRSVPWGGGKALMLVVTPRPGEAQEATALPNQPAVADLQARVAEMRTIIDTATDGVVLIGRDGAIRSISRPAEALFGFDSDEVAGKPFASLFAIESQRAARDYLNGLSEHGVASVLNDGREVIGRESQGRFIPLFMTIGRLPGDSGYCAVVRDITQWKRAEEELTQARAMAERASSQKSEFLARVSHEIRTPLNAIIGFSELMIDEKFGPVANDRYRDYLRDINRSGNHVLDLVNDLLDISKIEAGQQEMSYEAVSLNDTLAETVAMMQPQANRERVIIRSSFASKLPEVVADLRSVRQIALNILSNAVRYTQAGGQVIVSTTYEASGDVVMRVRDTGIGMSQAEIEQALKPFKQINALKRGRNDGTGLGLPLTKAMVEANRAKFSILSTPGEGTLVEITFPSTRVLAD